MSGIYIHIPFCVNKCKYCDFASFPDRLSKSEDYLEALLREMEEYKGCTADTIYIGGGTPTCLENDLLKKLLENVNRVFDFNQDAEFTVEANPGTVNAEKADILKYFNVNRISVGAQSFNDNHLKTLGRIHNSAQIIETASCLRKAGFKNLSFDLMYALPNQTTDDLSDSLENLLALTPEHISCYGLKYEDKTPFGEALRNGIMQETDEDTFADMYELITEKLKKSGYIHYEISNFAKKGYKSRHNLKYWNCEDYLGFGVAAASCIGKRRFTHSSDFDDYFNGYILNEDFVMTDDEAMHEFVILGLRVLDEGVNKAEFEKRFSCRIDDVFEDRIKRFEPFLINTETSLKLKPDAALVSNSILCEFINEL